MTEGRVCPFACDSPCFFFIVFCVLFARCCLIHSVARLLRDVATTAILICLAVDFKVWRRVFVCVHMFSLFLLFPADIQARAIVHRAGRHVQTITPYLTLAREWGNCARPVKEALLMRARKNRAAHFPLAETFESLL